MNESSFSQWLLLSFDLNGKVSDNILRNNILRHKYSRLYFSLLVHAADVTNYSELLEAGGGLTGLVMNLKTKQCTRLLHHIDPLILSLPRTFREAQPNVT